METLRYGSRGGDVARLHVWLSERGHHVPLDENEHREFGPFTMRGVEAVQRASGLAADGVVGPKTWAAVRGWVPPPHGLDEVRRVYGDIRIENGRVYPAEWEHAHMVSVSDLPGWPRRLYVNRAIVEPLREALRRCVELRDGYVINALGCFAPRAKRSNPAAMSLHSWGIPVDINPSTNQPLTDCPPNDPRRRTAKSIPDEWIDIFRDVGWTWGGDFKRDYFDPMHFQWASGV